MPHDHGTPTTPTHSEHPEATHDSPRETVREREIIVTNSGSPSARDRSSGFGLLVGLVVIVVLIVVGVFAVRAFSDAVDDAGFELPAEVDVNVDDGGDAPSN